ncbi:MAG: ATP-binding protein [Frankia sp.]
MTLTGPGGVGKTRLALEAAAQARRAFGDGVWWVDLASLRDGSLLVDEVSTVLGLVDRSARPALEKVAGFLAGQQVLLVLDNCEHLLDACGRFADQVLRGGPEVRILATSRRTLGIGGEHLVVVPPLAVPDPDASPREVAGCDAVSLLVERTAALVPGFAVTGDNHAAVARLCAQLDGIPLAIELAAARLRSLSVPQLLDRLSDRFAVLTGGSRAGTARQRTLRAMIDWSHDLCSEPERLLWARLSVFAGGFDLEAAEEVCGGGDLPVARLLDHLDGLVAQSVVLVEPGVHCTRFRLLETIRQYGRDRLVELGEEEAALRRHRDYYLRLAQGLAEAWCGPNQSSGLARLRTEQGNLRAAFETCLTDPQGPRAAFELTVALRFHWTSGGLLAEGRRWLDTVLALPEQPPPARMTALWVAAWVAVLQGDLPAVEDRLGECERLAASLPDRRVAAQALTVRGTATLFGGDMAESVKSFEQAATVLHDVGDLAGELNAFLLLATTFTLVGDMARAATFGQQGLALSQAHGERLMRSYVLWAMGIVAWRRGEPADAERLLSEGLAIQRGFNDNFGVPLMIETLAWIAESQDDHQRAAALLVAARAVWRQVGTTIVAFGPHLADHSIRCERRTRSALREAPFQAAVDAGRGITKAAAIALALDEKPADTAAAERWESPLSRRESQVAELVARGMTNRMIASRLVLSPRTVDGHVERIFGKLGFTSRAQLAAWVSAGSAPSGGGAAGSVPRSGGGAAGSDTPTAG